MDKMLARVVELESQGYQFEAAQGSFDLLVKKIAGHLPAALRADATFTSLSKRTTTEAW